MINNRCDTCVVGKTLASQCVQCDTVNGYIPSKVDLTKCVKSIPKCLTYTQNDDCNACATGFLLSNGRCDSCDAYNNFFLSNGTCACRPTHQLFNTGTSKCVKKVDYCLTYNNDICIACVEGKRLTSNQPPQCVDGIENCNIYTNYGCSKCMSGYYLLNKKCVALPSIKYCKNYYSCQANTFEGRLSTNQFCMECEYGYNLSGDKKACFASIRNCKKQINSTCQACVSGCYLDSTKNQCLVNPVCPPSTRDVTYDIINGKCIALDNNCKNFNEKR